MTRRRPKVMEPPAPSVGLGFSDPPDDRAGPKYDWAAIAKRCRRNPGEWYQVFKQDKTTYYSALLQGAISPFGTVTTARTREPVDHGFEVRSANTKRPLEGPRTCDLWLRYNPEKDNLKEGTTT